jgi:hypothetical protein
MRGATAAAVVGVAVLALTACAGSSAGQQRQAERGGAARIGLLHEVRAARASDPELSIFPVSIGGRSLCSIPIAYVGFITSKPPPLHGICQTRVHSARNRHEPLTVVVFSETWHWPPRCPPGDYCPIMSARPMRLSHRWTVWVEPPTTLGQKPVVLATHQRGNVAPQAPKT